MVSPSGLSTSQWKKAYNFTRGKSYKLGWFNFIAVIINGTLQVTNTLTQAKKTVMPKGCEITFGVDMFFSVDGITIKSADGSTIRARKRWINQEVQCTAKVKHVTQRSNYSLKTARRRQELPRHLDLRVWLSATITGLPEIPHPLGELLGRIHSGQDNHLYPATMKYKKDVSTTHVLRGFIYLFIYLFIILY